MDEGPICPECSSKADGPIISGNLRFYWCKNEWCCQPSNTSVLPFHVFLLLRTIVALKAYKDEKLK